MREIGRPTSLYKTQDGTTVQIKNFRPINRYRDSSIMFQKIEEHQEKRIELISSLVYGDTSYRDAILELQLRHIFSIRAGETVRYIDKSKADTMFSS